MQNFIYLWLLFTSLSSSLLAQTLSKETFLLETPYGNMKIKLYEETPLHKANFLRLANEHFFDSLLFHRVINNFMIQGGDYLSKHAKSGDSLGHGEIGYSVPAEFNRSLIHKKDVYVQQEMVMTSILLNPQVLRNFTLLWENKEAWKILKSMRKE